MMEVGAVEGQSGIGESTWWGETIWQIRYWAVQLRRKLPYLVWYDDELDVRVTLSQDRLPDGEFKPGEGIEAVIRPLFSGSFAECERIFGEMGIYFDRGMGCHGRDWEWDWSLKGPISVRFRARAMRPHLRREPPRPKLVVDNSKAAA